MTGNNAAACVIQPRWVKVYGAFGDYGAGRVAERCTRSRPVFHRLREERLRAHRCAAEVPRTDHVDLVGAAGHRWVHQEPDHRPSRGLYLP